MLSKLLLKYLYANSYEDALVKGKKIFKTSNINIVEQDKETHTLVAKVKDDTYSFFYNVKMINYNDVKRIYIRCNCNSKSHYLCKHKIGTLYLLMSFIDKEITKVQDIVYHQKFTILPMKNIDVRKLKSYSTEEIYSKAQNILASRKVKIIESSQSVVKGELNLANNEHCKITIFYNPNKEFETTCTCTETEAPICTHKLMLFLQLLGRFGADYFNEIKDDNLEKEVLMNYYEKYQQTENDEIEFVEEGKKTILKILQTPVTQTHILSNHDLESLVSKINLPATAFYGILFNQSKQHFPFFEIEMLYKEGEKILKIDKSEKNSYVKFGRNEREMIKDIAKITLNDAVKIYQKTNFTTLDGEDFLYYEIKDIPKNFRKFLIQYYLKHLNKIKAMHFYHLPIFISKKSQYANLKEYKLENAPVAPVIKISVQQKKLCFNIYVVINNTKIELENSSSYHQFYFTENQKLYIWKGDEVANILLLIYELQQQNINVSEWKDVFHTQLMPYIDLYEFEFEKNLVKTEQIELSNTHLNIQETEEYVYFALQFKYDNFSIDYNKSNHLIYTNTKGETILIKRNKALENEMFLFIQEQSKKWEIVENNFSDYKFFIKKTDALADSWFVEFLENIKKKNISISGIELLKNFTPIEKTPKVSMDISSGIDWLDVDIKIEIDDQEVSLDSIINMFKTDTNTMVLADSKIVAIPKNWIRKYKLLFALAERNTKNSLKLKNSQIGIIQYIEKEESHSYLSINWREKSRQLGFNKNKELHLPYGLEKVLRGFQIDSIRWSESLKAQNCNGLLSDDMGLGKTLQALSILSLYKKQNKKIFALIICPTSLTHTWSQEIKKFTPDLTYQFFHGKDRQFKKEADIKEDLMITTYGTIRNDFHFFKQMIFDYIVLDESQNIKNPQSKTYQVLVKLNAKNKLCLSGTPLQNNTVDMFAQMSFLNHGMFGSLHWFKSQFSTPIDKFGDFEIKNMLRKILQPLILRRTKEEVSPELPEKTISTIYCEMEPEQRKIYEAYKNEFRNTLLGKIKKEGIAKSKFHILQALLILRQICNTPALIKSGVNMPKVSIKNDILIESLLQNIQNHKILVFSQFLGMLDLIRDTLIQHKIKFEYLDGSLSINKRKTVVEKFESQSEVKVFLISLKAGGLGLTLTAADYVYIVDPWWNPTIEAQAIDRTHRIGQTKKIIANKLICKNTVEEKIVQLQQKKTNLNNDIIEKEENLISHMNIEDIDFLLS